ncbi:unnamed protein product [Oikopleura dioica]|uniref:Uncharacterized protein n=1 Tax=Oikopleura dioica TaxID=34765 RepID=E4YRZ7_OIKDI|nr:unnamed protein product [Oikopleura dioica]
MKCIMENVVGDSVMVVIEDEIGEHFKREECLPKRSRTSKDIRFALKKLIRMEFLWRHLNIRALKVSLMYTKDMDVKLEPHERFNSPFFANKNNSTCVRFSKIEELNRARDVRWAKNEKISSVPRKKVTGKRVKKEDMKLANILTMFKNNDEVKKDENSMDSMKSEDSRSREPPLVNLTNIPGTSEMNYFQIMSEDSNSNQSINCEPRNPAKNSTMNPKASALVEEYRNIDENSMDAMLAQIIDDPKEREALLSFSGAKAKPVVNHSKLQPTKSTKKTRGRPKKTPPKKGSVQESTIFQMFKKADSKKSNK